MSPRIVSAFDGLVFARNYTIELLDTIPESEWFYAPTPAVSHIAWQVGHLTIAEYALCLKRTRGVIPSDAKLIPSSYTKLFGRESMIGDPSQYPTPAALRSALDAVHQEVLAYFEVFPENELDLPTEPVHRYCRTKRDCLFWVSQHEMLHAGQIGLLRRLLGHKPVW